MRTIDDVIDAIADFVQIFVGSAEIVRAQVNRVPQPPTPCVVLTELRHTDVATPHVIYDGSSGHITIQARNRLTVQVDIYGPDSGDQCRAIAAAWRSEYPASVLPAWCAPLECGDCIQSPQITGEKQWGSRWMIDLSMQYNPTVTLPQDFAQELQPNLIQADK